MASIKTEEEIEIFKQIAHVYKVAEKMAAAALDLMKSAKTKETVDRAHRVSSDAEEVVQIASIIKSQMRKLSEKEALYVEFALTAARDFPPGGGKAWALWCAQIDRIAKECYEERLHAFVDKKPPQYKQPRALTEEPRSPRTFWGAVDEVRTAHRAEPNVTGFGGGGGKKPLTYKVIKTAIDNYHRAHNGQEGEVVDGKWAAEAGGGGLYRA